MYVCSICLRLSRGFLQAPPADEVDARTLYVEFFPSHWQHDDVMAAFVNRGFKAVR